MHPPVEQMGLLFDGFGPMGVDFGSLRDFERDTGRLNGQSDRGDLNDLVQSFDVGAIL